MTGSPSGKPELTAGAEAAFASYLARVHKGEEVDFDAFCADRPNLADSLRRLRSAWDDVRRSGRVMSIRHYLAETIGEKADPNISLDDDAPKDASGSGVHRRLDSLAERAGRYELRGEVARGGMGVVFKVWDQDLRRTLAMKAAFGNVTNLTDVEAPSMEVQHISRFLEEAQITGQLDHPGVVPVHELGVDDEGRMFFTMRLVKGETLDDITRKARAEEDGWSRPRAVDVILRVCEAMAYAHSKGVIHRDLKPANVMVGKFGEVYVMDWGLAKVLGRPDPHARPDPRASIMQSRVLTDRIEDLSRTPDSPLMTMEGTVIGTPTYMPPEQAEGRIDDLDPRSDVYSVGALLYTLLTGRMPYVDPDKPATPGRVLMLLMAGPPKPVHEIDHSVPPELVAICEKAMARKPEDRYRNMIEMAEDLRAYIERRVVKAYETGALAELKKWVMRNKIVAALAAALLLVATGSAFFVAWEQKEKVNEVRAAQALTTLERDRATRNAREARANAARASENAERAERQSYLANLAAAHASLRMNETDEARGLLDACPEPFRGWEWRHLQLAADTSLRVLEGHEGKVTGVAFRPGGGRLASTSEDRTVNLWDPESGRLLFPLPGATEPGTAVAYSPDGKHVAAASRDLLVRVWDAEAGRLIGTLAGHESVVTSLAFNEDGTRLVTGSADETARVWDVAAFRSLAALGHDGTVHAVAFAPGGELLATVTDEGVHVWRAAGGLVRTIELEDVATCVAWGPVLAAGTLDGGIVLLDAATGAKIRMLRGHADPVSVLAFCQGRLLSGSYDKTVRVWDPETGEALSVLRGHSEAVLAVAGSASEGLVASGSADRTIRLWRLEGGEAVLTLKGDEDFLSAVAFEPTGERVVATSAGHGEIRVWDGETGEPLSYIPEDGGGLSSVAFSADGRWIVAGGEEDATARIHDAASGEMVRRLVGHELSVTSVAFDPDGRRVLTGSADATARLWDRETGEVLRVLEGHDDRVTGVAFAPDGLSIASGSLDGTVRLWDAATGAPGRVLQGAPVLAVAFTPDGAQLAAACGDGTIRLWDAATGETGPVLEGHAGAVTSLAFQADGNRLVSGGRDKTVRVWDVRTGDPLLRLLAHDGWVTSVAFASDGTRIASASFDTRARIWRSATAR